MKVNIPPDFNGTWIEPFMGTGAVAFNLAPKKQYFVIPILI